MHIWCLLLLLPLVQGAIVSLAQTGVYPPKYELDLVDPQSGQVKKIVDLNFLDITVCGVLRDNNTFIFGRSIDQTINAVDLSTGKIQESPSYPNYYFHNIAFDKVTNQTFVTASRFSHFLLEVLPDLSLREMARFEGHLIEQGRISTYSSSKHIFFLLLKVPRSDLSLKKPQSGNLVAVSTGKGQEGKVLYNVSVDLEQILTLVYDDTFGVLYVWAYQGPNHQASLFSVDYTTGKILNIFAHVPWAIVPGPAVINKEGTVMYTFLTNIQSSMTYSVIHTLELRSGNPTLARTINPTLARTTRQLALTMDFLQ